MTSVTRVLVVRHGQSEWNLSGRWQGQADPALTELGRAQARAAAHNLGQLDAIWTSDLQRAAQTATVIAEELGLGPVVPDTDLRERDVGDWTGLTRDQIDRRYPGYLSPPNGAKPEGWTPPRPAGWESDPAVVGRATQALLRIREHHETGHVLVVSHAGLLYSIERTLGVEASRFGNLEGRWLELRSSDDEAQGRWATMRLADIARLGDRLALLPADQVTLPNEI
jgi:probable phosphoglycerate mutase